MPTLDEKQRQWLDAALQARGRFTRAKSVKDDWEKYRRRRAKAATALEAVGADAPARALIENGLQAADQQAEQGKFGSAYKRLDAIKGMAKAAGGGNLAVIANGDLNGRAAVLGVSMGRIEASANFAVSHFGALLTRMDGLATCNEQPDLDAALTRRKALVDEEINLRADLANREDWVRRTLDTINADKPMDAINEAEEQISMYTRAGLADDIVANVQRIFDLRSRAEANAGRYHDPAVMRKFGADMRTRFENRMREIKSLSAYQQTEGTGTPDEKARSIQGDLRVSDNLDLVTAQADQRFQAAEIAMMAAGIMDNVTLDETDRGPVTLAAEPRQFDAGTVFDDLLGANEDVPDDIPVGQADDLVQRAKAKMDAVVKALPADSDEMFDLILQTREDFARMCSQSLTGVDGPGGLSQSHAVCFQKMADEMLATVLENCPNKMADDAQKISVGGVDYNLKETLGEGGFGAARRFLDPVTGKTVVVKSLKGAANAEKRQSMVDEMRTHRRALNGDDADLGAENLVEMTGAAISGDGSLHMIMEDAEGGDLSQTANNMTMLVDQGLLTPEARDALALDMLMQTVKGMKAMEARGLVHNDMKPANMLINKDGTVKIIDFGESRFGDDQGEAPSAKASDFGTTKGYEAPETYEQDTVTSKADSFALGGIAKALLRFDADQDGAVAQKPEDVSALGRLSNALGETDPDKRPSLDAVLASALMLDQQNAHAPEDLEDLRKASAEVNAVLSNTRDTITKDEFDRQEYGVQMDSGWMPFFNKLQAGQDQNVPISLLQNMAAMGDAELEKERAKLGQGTGEQQQTTRDKIEALDAKRKFWADKADAALKQTRDEGKQQLDNVLTNSPATIDVPGTGGGSMTVPAAVTKRETLETEIRNMQDLFYAASNEDPETALQNLEATNERLTQMATQIEAINTAISDLLGPEGRFYLAELKLTEVSARFGPARNAPRAPDRGDAPAPAAEGEDVLRDDDTVTGAENVANQIFRRGEGLEDGRDAPEEEDYDADIEG